MDGSNVRRSGIKNGGIKNTPVTLPALYENW